MARYITPAGWFYLQGVGPLIGQQFGAEGACQAVSEF
jgi:hypothetical protein